ncbi:MAG: hypothetical protein HPY76_15035 [Anaerolineae bacterium]|nr:hypothetical protein [Anaerolineae bacterium]
MKDFFNDIRYTRYLLIQRYNSTEQLLQLFASDPTFSQQINSQLEQIASQLSPDYKEIIANQVLDQKIDTLIIEQEANARGITVSEAEQNEAFNAAFGYYPDGTPTATITSQPILTPTYSKDILKIVTLTPTYTPFPTLTPTELLPTATLDPNITPEPTATEYTLDGFQTQVKDYLDLIKETGYSEKDIRALIKAEVLRDRVFKAITGDVPVEEEQVWARHILVATEEEANTVLDRLNQGDDFAALAAEFSQDTSNKDRGGDLGWFRTGDMVPEFELVAYGLEPGEISKPVKTEFGYHIIQVIAHETRPLTQTQLDDAKQAVFDEWLTTARNGDGVQRFDNWQEFIPTEPSLQSQSQ